MQSENLTGINPGLGDLDKLYHLDLQRNNIEFVPNISHNMTSLLVVNLTFNKIKYLLSSLYSLKLGQTVNIKIDTMLRVFNA